MHGFLILDKPPEASSAQALEPIKRALGRGVKVGHAGTLDPLATGVLLALLGDGTRLSEAALGLPKTYVASVRFGIGTRTLDTEGEVTVEADPGAEPPEGLEETLSSFRGEIEQVPPVHSALWVDGRRSYDLARTGHDAKLPPRRVVVHDVRLLETDWPDIRFALTCGAGTYVRSLARDLGGALGLPAHLTALRRTRVGPFTVEEGAAPEGLERREAVRAALRPTVALARAAGFPEVLLRERRARTFAAGQPVPVPVGTVIPAGTRTAVLHGTGERLLGLGTVLPGGALQPYRVLRSEAESLRE